MFFLCQPIPATRQALKACSKELVTSAEVAVQHENSGWEMRQIAFNSAQQVSAGL